MKRLLTVIAFFAAVPAFSQGLEVTALGGYTTSGGLQHDTRTVEDLKLAVDETCSTLITMAADDAVLSCHFAVDGKGAVRVAAKIAGKSAAGPDEGSFGWRVLTALVDSVETRVEETEGFVVHIGLVKSSAGAVDA